MTSAKNLLCCNAPLLLCRTFLLCALYSTPTIQSIPLPRRALRSTSSFPTQYFLPSQIQCSLPCQTGSRLHPTPCVPCQPQYILFFTRLIWYTVLLTRSLPPLFKRLHDYCVLQINVHYPHPTSDFVSSQFYSYAMLQSIVHLVPYMIIHPVIHNPLSVRFQWYYVHCSCYISYPYHHFSLPHRLTFYI